MCVANLDTRPINAISERGQFKLERSPQHLLSSIVETEDNEIISGVTTLEANLVDSGFRSFKTFLYQQRTND